MATLGTPPGRLNLRIVAGEPFDVFIPILDGSGELVTTAGSPSWSSEAQIRTVVDSPTVLHNFDTDISAGTVHVSATGLQTAEWQADWVSMRNPWDLAVTDLDGDLHYLTAGWVTLYPTITR